MESQQKAIFKERKHSKWPKIINSFYKEWVEKVGETYKKVAPAMGEKVVISKRNDELIKTIDEYIESEKLVLTECSHIEATTVEVVMAKVETALAEGWNATRLQDAIIGSGAFSPERALMLSRTIVGTAASMGQTIAAEETGATHKRWMNQPSRDTRPEHIARHQETQKKPIKIDARYSAKFGATTGPKYPLDNILKPADRVNCRCSQNFMILDEPKVVKPVKQVAKPKPKSVKFVPQKTAKAAEKWALDNDLADVVDYGGMAPEMANRINERLQAAIEKHPEIRKTMRFLGSIQARNKLWYDTQLKKGANLRILKPKRAGRQYAQSASNSNNLDGISFNKRYFSTKKIKSTFLQKKSEMDSGWTAKAVPEWSTIDHEIGHQIYDSMDENTRKSLKSYYANTDPLLGKFGLGQYAMQNHKEMVADAYAEFSSNPKPRKMALEIMKLAGIE